MSSASQRPLPPAAEPTGQRVCVVGAGYVGLTTAVGLAHLGHDVVCADIDADKVAALAAGSVTHHEPGIPELLASGLASGRLRFVHGAPAAVPGARFVYLCLPTPMLGDGRPDISALLSVADEIGPLLESEAVVVNKSTVPVGAHRLVGERLGRGDVAVVSNPEFLREGQAVRDFFAPDRIVIGADDADVAIAVAGLFSSLACPVVATDPVSAETIKYAANAFLATKLSFVNSLASVCEVVGADASDVLVGIGSDPRIGHDFLRPGPGWGGSCFPKDVRALLHLAGDAGFDFALLRAVIDANATHFDRVAAKVLAAAGDRGDDTTDAGAPPRVAVWGLTFKADTDDLRESPALEVVRRLAAAGASVRAYDPVIDAGRLAAHAPDLDVEVVADPYAACAGADVLVVLTEWDEFRHVDLAKVGDVVGSRRVVDTRNVLDRQALQRLGFVADNVGGR